MNSVEPIRDQKLLARIMYELEQETDWHWKRIFLLFATSYYMGLRVGDIVRFKKRHVMGEFLRMKEEKTGKPQRIPIADDLRIIFDERLADMDDDDYLFPSRKRNPDGSRTHITTGAAWKDMQMVRKRFGLEFPFSPHSLRKTHGYMRYVYGGDRIDLIRDHFNHGDESTTRRYIGIAAEERDKSAKKVKAGGYRYRPAGGTKKRKKNDTNPENDDDVLTIKRQDRHENGRKWGTYQQEKLQRKREKEEQQEVDKARSKVRKAFTDQIRYERGKAKENERNGAAQSPNAD